MKMAYPVILTYDDGVILVEVPDMDVFTQGENVADAISMARDAVGLKGISMEDAGEVIPEASRITDVDVRNSEFFSKGNTVVALVDIDFLDYRRKNDNKMVRRNVTLPNWMNLAAEKEGLNVSKVLQEALKERLQVIR